MTSEQLFQVVNFVPLPFWALMIFAPRWWLTRRVMGTLIAPALFAVVYAILVVPQLRVILPVFLETPKLAAIAGLLGDPEVAVVAWSTTWHSICSSVAGNTSTHRKRVSADGSSVLRCSSR